MRQPILLTNPRWAGPDSNFFGSLKSDPGWVGLLNHQLMVGQVGLPVLTA